MSRLLAMVIAMIPSVALAQQTPAKPPAKLTLYKTIDSAACSGDATVWVDSDAHVYYLKGDKFFGKTKHGGYNCRKQADVAGYGRVAKLVGKVDGASPVRAVRTASAEYRRPPGSPEWR